MAEARNPGWGRRLREARVRWELAHDERLTLQGLADRITAAGTPVTYQTVQRWLKGYEPQSFATVAAVGRALNADPGWLAFGKEERREPVDVSDRELPPITTYEENPGAAPIGDAARKRRRRSNG